MRRMLPHLRPVLATLVVSALSALAVHMVIEQAYGVALVEGNYRAERPAAVFLLFAAPIVLLVRGYLYRKRLPRLRVSQGANLKAVASSRRVWLGAALTGMRVTALWLIGVALMGPQSIHARDATEVQGIDIVLAMDLSLSMQAGDIEPNRFVATQQVVDGFVRRRANDRIGAVIFGRDAYTLLPLTTDHEALRTMIGGLELGSIDGRGTAIGNAVGVALNRLRKSDAKSKVIILLTDGDSNSGNVSPTQAAEFARALDVKVYTILMGRTEKAPVQMGKDLFGRALFDKGNFPINPELLKQVAKQTGAEAFQVSDRQELERSFHTILDQLEKSQIEDAGRVYGELFAAFVAPALLLLALELWLGALVLRRWP